jgi:hypothetical protein
VYVDFGCKTSSISYFPDNRTTEGGKVAQPYAPAALLSQRMVKVRLEKLSKLKKKSNDLIWIPIRDLPACSLCFLSIYTSKVRRIWTFGAAYFANSFSRSSDLLVIQVACFQLSVVSIVEDAK